MKEKPSRQGWASKVLRLSYFGNRTRIAALEAAVRHHGDGPGAELPEARSH